MVFITGHTLSVVSGVPVLRSRAGLSGYSQYDKVLQSGIGCEKSLPVINSSYDSSGNLTWDASNVTDVYIRSYCSAGGCYYNLFDNPSYIGYYDDLEQIPVINNMASGYEEFYNNYDIFGGDVKCIYSVYGSNKCCSLESGCGIGTACLGWYYRYLNESVEFPPYPTDDFVYNQNYPCIIDEAKLCWNLDRDLQIANYYNDIFEVTLNGEEVEYSDCIIIPYGSAMEESYTLAVKNNCGTNVVKTVKTTCCARKDSAVIEIVGLSDLNYDDNNDYGYTFNCPVGNGNYSGSEAGNITETYSINYSALNGTYVVPLCYYGGTPDVIEPENTCRSKIVYTGSKITISYSYSYTYSGSTTNISYISGNTKVISYNGYTTVNYTYEADICLSTNGFIFTNSIINHIITRYEYAHITETTYSFLGDPTITVTEQEYSPVTNNTTYSCEDDIFCGFSHTISPCGGDIGFLSFEEYGTCNEYLTDDIIVYPLHPQVCSCSDNPPLFKSCSSVFGDTFHYLSTGRGYSCNITGELPESNLLTFLSTSIPLTYRISFI